MWRQRRSATEAACRVAEPLRPDALPAPWASTTTASVLCCGVVRLVAPVLISVICWTIDLDALEVFPAAQSVT